MNQREAKRKVCLELARIAADLEAPPSLSVEDELRWNLAVGDLYVELQRRAGNEVVTQFHVEGQLELEML